MDLINFIVLFISLILINDAICMRLIRVKRNDPETSIADSQEKDIYDFEDGKAVSDKECAKLLFG